MDNEFSDTDLVFGDLRHVAEELSNEHSSPVRVRRLFGRFITLSQQLTEAMRKEFNNRHDTRWNASEFEGWSPVTDLFKELRNTDQYGCPVTINVRETQYIAVGDIFGDGIGSSETVISGTWDLGDPFSEHIPEGLQLVSADPKTGKPSDEIIEPRRRQYVFIISPRTEALAKLLSAAGTTDAHDLAQQCFATLTDYYDFYKRALKEV